MTEFGSNSTSLASSSTYPVTSSESTTISTQPTTITSTKGPPRPSTTLMPDAGETSSTVSSITTPSPSKFAFKIHCLRENGRILIPFNNSSVPYLPQFDLSDSFDISIPGPNIVFEIYDVNENEVIVHFDRVFYGSEVVLVYYPGDFNASDNTLNEKHVKDALRCDLIYKYDLKIMNLQPSMSYTFCALLGNGGLMTPFNCKLHKTVTPYGRQPWIVQEHKVIIITSLLVLILIALFIGVSMTYLLIRRKPTLMRGGKRVVMVNNRTKDVMVLPKDQRNGSCHKDSSVKESMKEANYMTPLPRQRFNTKYSQIQHQ